LHENIKTDNEAVIKKRVIFDGLITFCIIFVNAKLKQNVMRSAIKHIIILLVFVAMNAGVAVSQPRAVKKALKKQAKKEQAERKAIIRAGKETRKRAYEIQSPEVKKRMKQNRKEIAARDRAQKRQNNSKTKMGAKKYR